MDTLYLARHVHVCVTEDHAVLLDLRRDKYVGVSREQMAVLARRVKDWPQATGDPCGSVASSNTTSAHAPAESVLSRMLTAGMLTTNPQRGKGAAPLAMPQAEAALVEPDLESQPEVKLTHVLRFLRASAVAALALRSRSIESVLMAVGASKARRRDHVLLDLDAARRATGAFIRLRPLLFGAQDACLLDSLALVRFLSYYELYPTCVIGVQTAPFGAHCWVQEGSVVFNDAPEYVRRFTPILAV